MDVGDEPRGLVPVTDVCVHDVSEQLFWNSGRMGVTTENLVGQLLQAVARCRISESSQGRLEHLVVRDLTERELCGTPPLAGAVPDPRPNGERSRGWHIQVFIEPGDEGSTRCLLQAGRGF